MARRTGKSRVTSPKAKLLDEELSTTLYTPEGLKEAEDLTVQGEDWIFDEAIDLVPEGIKFNTTTGDVIVREDFDFPMSEKDWQTYVEDVVASPMELNDQLEFGGIELDESGKHFVTESGKESLLRLFRNSAESYLFLAYPEEYALVLATHERLAAGV